MPKMKNGSIKENKMILVFLLIIVLLLCFLYVIKVMGRIDTSGYSLEDLSNLNNPDEIFVASPINDYYGEEENTNTGTEKVIDNKGNVNANTNGNTVNHDDNKNEIIEEGFWIKDKNQVWESTKSLKIFENPIYNNREVIAPGSSNNYAFTLINNNTFAVECDIKFVETNRYNINMKYRLKQNGNYIIGDSTNWVTCQNMKVEDILIESNKNIPYILEWKWFDSSNDTAIGKISDATYGLYIEVYAEEI